MDWACQTQPLASATEGEVCDCAAVCDTRTGERVGEGEPHWAFILSFKTLQPPRLTQCEQHRLTKTALALLHRAPGPVGETHPEALRKPSTRGQGWLGWGELRGQWGTLSGRSREASWRGDI